MARQFRPTQTQLPVQFSAQQVQLGVRICTQQCWLFGYDIRYREGNLLYAYGLERIRAADSQGSNMYCTTQSDMASLCLWSFGMYFGWPDIGGVYLARFQFIPRLIIHPTNHHTACLPDHIDVPTPMHVRHYQAYMRLIDWLMGYETWVIAQYGWEYRNTAIQANPKAYLRLPATDICATWNNLCTPVLRMQHNSGDKGISVITE